MLQYFNQKRRNSAMERETICKNRASLKSHTSKKNQQWELTTIKINLQ
jgi:hypothetical protein